MKVKVIRGARDIVDDRLDMKEYGDTFTVLSEMPDYMYIMNDRISSTYFFYTDKLKEIKE